MSTIKFKYLIFISASLFSSFGFARNDVADRYNPEITDSRQCVILLHGLARSSKSMVALEKRLKKSKYEVVNINYPSKDFEISQLAEMSISRGLRECRQRDTTKINFVTHSMGGLLVRHYYSIYNSDAVNRVVMLGPPNQGSEVVDELKDVPGFRFINGPAGYQLGTAKDSYTNSLGDVDFDLGIIAGNKSVNFLFSTLLPNADDGKVSVESTKVEGMKDHIEMDTTHTFMMLNPKVINQVMNFLRQGNFERPKPKNPAKR